jgi:hypothetical protein
VICRCLSILGSPLGVWDGRPNCWQPKS